MFGTLRPHNCTLPTEQQKAHRRFYCGLCKTLGDEYSQLSRATLNFDAVFIALLGDALAQEAAPQGSCRCPMIPIQHRETIDPNSPAMRYAAAVQMLLADQWVADHLVEGKALAKLARPLLQKPVQKAHEILQDLRIDLSALHGFEHKQAAQEVLGQTHPLQASFPTEEALAIVFTQLAALPSSHPNAQTPENKAALAQLGRAIGRVIYLTDALDDLRDDFLRNKFNPCLT
ncbi:MAG: hypothetical protein H6727_17315, partial [Myxococcales bacterium]|nr:hypothetical protein [Myxococcales bacterium]